VWKKSGLLTQSIALLEVIDRETSRLCPEVKNEKREKVCFIDFQNLFNLTLMKQRLHALTSHLAQFGKN